MASLLVRSAPLSVQPEVRPAPLAALALDESPTEFHFVRSHFGVPPIEARAQPLAICGAVRRELRLSLADLQSSRAAPGGWCWSAPGIVETSSNRRLPECNGASARSRKPDGPVWCSPTYWRRWTHRQARARSYSRGPTVDHIEARTRSVPFARSIPLERARLADVLLAWEMNGAPIPAKHGAPLRAIVPGNDGVRLGQVATEDRGSGVALRGAVPTVGLPRRWASLA